MLKKSMTQLWRTALVFVVLINILILFLASTRFRYFNLTPKEAKYVAFHLNWGRMCNQLFHLITGYGIARTLNRVHYLPYDNKVLPHVQGYLEKFKEIFPRLQQTYVIAKNGTNQTEVSFAGSCCRYDDPRRLLNNTAKYIRLGFTFGQNSRYFEDYLDDVRKLLQFSSRVSREGDYIIDSWHLARNNTMCLHTRVTDFVVRNISTDIKQTVTATNSIAKRLGLKRFLIFGDDGKFMANLSLSIIEAGKWKKDVVVISRFKEDIDFYLSSQVCRSFLITAVTSTFGWWLAFFSIDQNAVFYVTDNRKHADKIPSKELFLKTWRQV